MFYIIIASNLALLAVLAIAFKLIKAYRSFIKEIDCAFTITTLKKKFPKLRCRPTKYNEDIYYVSYYLFHRVFIDKAYIAREIATIKLSSYTLDEKFIRLNRLVEDVNAILEEYGSKDTVDFVYNTKENTVSLTVMKNFKGDA